MPFDGSGGFLRTQNWQADAAAGIKIVADRHDNEDDNFASGLSSVITKDGQTSLTGNIPFNGFRATVLGNPVDPQDAATKSYVDNNNIFATGIILPGSDANGRIKFTGTVTPGAGGRPLGFEWTQISGDGIGFGAIIANTPTTDTPTRWTFNDKADFSGKEVAHITDAGQAKFTYSLSLVWDDAGPGLGPVLELFRDSPSPEANDTLGYYSWTGRNSSTAKVTYADMYGGIIDPTHASEDGYLAFRRMVAGVMTGGAALDSTGFIVNQKLTVQGEATVVGRAHLQEGAEFNASGQWNNVTYLNDLYSQFTTGYTWVFRTTGAESGDLQYWANNIFVFNIDYTGAVNCLKGASFDEGKTFLASADATNKYLQYEGNHFWQYVRADGQLLYFQGSVYALKIAGGYCEFPTQASAPVGMTFNPGRDHFLGPSGAHQIHQYQTNYYWLFDSSAGTLNWFANGSARVTIHPGGDLDIGGNIARKQQAGQWTALSDARLKIVRGDYTPGLAEIRQVQPVNFSFKNDPDKVYSGFIAQDIETVFPETVSLGKGEIDGQPVDDLRSFDPTSLLWAALNAIKELATRVEALEGT